VKHEGARRRFRVVQVAACEFPSQRGSQALIGGVGALLAARGHTVHTVSFSRRRRRALPHGPSWRRLGADLVLLWRLYRFVSQRPVDLLHAHNYEGVIAACLIRAVTGLPVIYHAHNTLTDELPFYGRTAWQRSLARRAGHWLDRWVPRQADFTIALTDEVAEFLASCRVDGDRMRVVPPVIASVAASSEGPSVAPSQRQFVVAYAGNLDAYQDLDVLGGGFARFAAGHPSAVLRLVTHESEWQSRLCSELQQLVTAGRAEVIVVAGPEAEQGWLESADLLVCPRRSWSGFPMKLFSYAAAGRPIVIAAEAARSLCDGEALVFAGGNRDALAEALAKAAGDAALRQRLSAASRSWWRRMTDTSIAAAALEEIYQAVESANHYGGRARVQD